MHQFRDTFTTGWKREWIPRVSSRFRSDANDERFTDDDILNIVRAGEEGNRITDLCAAEGIAVETYYVWKAKYGGLTSHQINRLRQRERRSGRTTFAVVVLLVAVFGGGYMFVAPRSIAPPSQPPAIALESSVVPQRTAAPVFAGPPVPAVIPQIGGLDVSAPQGTHPANANMMETKPVVDNGRMADRRGYSVQLAALPDVTEARTLVEQLIEKGYPAYLTPATVDDVKLYRVRVGSLQTRITAEEMARRLEVDGYSAPWVTK